jgi:hypothetical protein
MGPQTRTYSGSEKNKLILQFGRNKILSTEVPQAAYLSDGKTTICIGTTDSTDQSWRSHFRIDPTVERVDALVKERRLEIDLTAKALSVNKFIPTPITDNEESLAKLFYHLLNSEEVNPFFKNEGELLDQLETGSNPSFCILLAFNPNLTYDTKQELAKHLARGICEDNLFLNNVYIPALKVLLQQCEDPELRLKMVHSIIQIISDPEIRRPPEGLIDLRPSPEESTKRRLDVIVKLSGACPELDEYIIRRKFGPARALFAKINRSYGVELLFRGTGATNVGIEIKTAIERNFVPPSYQSKLKLKTPKSTQQQRSL